MAADARIITSLPSHPKTKKLLRRLGPAGPLGCIYLFLWAASNRSDGDLSGMSDEDIELAVDWAGAEGAFVREMALVGFLDGLEGERSIHDWAEHNPWAAGSIQRSQRSKYAALCKQYGRAMAATMMPEYAETLRDAHPESAASTDLSANGTPKAPDASAASTPDAVPEHATSVLNPGNRSAPSPSPSPLPSPSPSPLPSPLPIPIPTEEEANASLSTASPPTSGELVLDGEPEEPPSKADQVPACPYDALIDAYEAKLPALPQPRRSLFKGGKGGEAMRQRWRWVMTEKHERGEQKGERYATTVAEGVEWFGRYFDHAAASDFLTGRDGKWPGCNLAWLMIASKFENVLSGTYHKAEVEHA